MMTPSQAASTLIRHRARSSMSRLLSQWPQQGSVPPRIHRTSVNNTATPVPAPVTSAASRWAPVRNAQLNPSPSAYPSSSPSPSAARVHRQSSRWKPPPPSPSPTRLRSEAESIVRTRMPTSRSSTSTTPSNPPPNTQFLSRQRLLLSYHDLEEALERRGLRSVRALLAAAAFAACAIGLAWPRIKQWGGRETAEVAAASLKDEQLQANLSSMVNAMLTDDSTQAHVEHLLKNAVVNLLSDDDFTDSAVEWTAQVLRSALDDDTVIEKGTEYVGYVLQTDESINIAKEFLTEAVNDLVQDESLQDNVASGLWSGIRATVLGRRRTVPANPKQRPVTERSKPQTMDTATEPQTLTQTQTEKEKEKIAEHGASEQKTALTCTDSDNRSDELSTSSSLSSISTSSVPPPPTPAAPSPIEEDESRRYRRGDVDTDR